MQQQMFVMLSRFKYNIELEMDTRRRSLRIVMLPWLAHGHISPFLELAKALSKRNFVIYICSTPINLNSIREKLSEKDSISIKVVELQIPSLPELPPHYHTTNGLPPHLMPTLKEAFDMAKPSFSNILLTLKPDLVIYDFIQPWAPAVALSQHIPAVLFLSPGAASTSFLYHFRLKSCSKYPFPAIYYRSYEYKKYAHMIELTANGLRDTDRVFGCVAQSSDIILIKSWREIEAKYIDYLSALCQKKIVPVGPLVQDPGNESDQHKEITEWLNKKERGSTVFASFGSEYFLTKEEMEETALGLELSGLNFIWVVRFPLHENIKVEEALPRGFLERVKEKAIIVEGWAPQGKILGHESVGGFVSHCGWSSVMEGIKYGVPIVAMPMHLDQPLNARLVEELGVGEEVVRDKEGKLEKEEVARVIRKVVVDITGEKLRKVKELSEEMMEKEDEEMDVVVEEITKLCRKNERQDSMEMLCEKSNVTCV